jgi:predicted phage terminase large subunit-like protein
MMNEADLFYDVLDDEALEAELGSRSLHEYIKLAWPEVEPSNEFVDNWHIGAICEHLEAVIDGQITRLVINVPPGTMKSLTCCVFFPSWVWGPRNLPGKKLMFGSYTDRLAYRDSLRTRNLVNSDFYRRRWGNRFKLTTSSLSKFDTDAAGWRMATTVRGGATGEHADIQLVDDPLKPYEVTRALTVTGTALEDCRIWWSETMASRLVSIVKSARIIIMQRLHDADLAGAVLKEGGYEHLMLPMAFESKRKCFTSIGFEDPRTEEGELLFVERFPQEAVDKQAKEMGSRAARAQHQQDPILLEGNIIHGNWIQHWEQEKLPLRWLTMIQSWDCTFKDSDGTDFVAGQVWALGSDSNFYLLDQVCERMGLVDTCLAMKRMSKKWPKTFRKLIENKANGPAVYEVMKKRIKGLRLVEPEGGKIARVHAMEPVWEAGEVFIPPADVEWVGGYISELTGFPAKAHDDQVDATSQALLYLQTKSIKMLKDAMAKQERLFT